jgi:hypothetical protein
MNYFSKNKIWLSILVFVVAFAISCGGDDGGSVTPNDCATPPSLNLSVSKQPACSAFDGVIEATASGGNGGFTYSKDGTTFQTSNTFNNLAAGNYEITVKDTKGCTTKKTVTVTSVGSNLSLSLEVSKNLIVALQMVPLQPMLMVELVHLLIASIMVLFKHLILLQ